MLRTHYFVMVFMITLCGFGLHQAVYFGMASFHNYAVLNMLKNWQDSPTQHSINDYSRIKAKAQQAVLYHPDHAEYWDLLAQVNEWGVIFAYEDGESTLLEVKKHYMRATKLRPLWPDSWASLVKLKWRLQEFDEEMLWYFERATTLGLQKPKVHFIVIELGLAMYAYNHPMLLKIRAEFHHRLALALKHPKTRTRVRSLISEYKSQALVCRWLKDEDINTRKLIPKCK